MSDKRLRQPSFIEKRKKWRSSLDKPMGPFTLLTVLPALGLCVFLVLAAPYLKSLLAQFFASQQSEIRPVDVAEETLAPPKPEPPPSPESVAAALYRQRFEAEGIDWRSPPKLDIPPEPPPPLPESLAPKPVEVDLRIEPELDENLDAGLLEAEQSQP